MGKRGPGQLPGEDHVRAFTYRRKCVGPGCKKAVPSSMRSDAIYCGDVCRQRASNERKKARRLITKRKTMDERAEQLEANKLEWRKLTAEQQAELQILHSNNYSIDHIAKTLNLPPRNVTILINHMLQEDTLAVSKERASEAWEMDPQVAWMLGKGVVMPNPLNEDACMEWAIDHTLRFLSFEHAYFRLPKNQHFIRKAFHINWVTEVLFAYATGGYLQIMSPPRHGKSQLMVHFSVWLIARDPDIRILWVGPNMDIAGDFVGAVAEALEFNTEMIEATLPETRRYAPDTKGAGVKWSKAEFRVENRTPGLVGSTMTAVGRGGKILSRNADFIYCDDLEDYESTLQPGKRAGTRRWAGITLDSRKMEHTAMVYIGSRQHPEDLYGHNMEDPNFRIVTDSAHSLECVLDPLDHSLHVDCMLFPEVNSYRWLMSKKHGADARQEEGIFEMVYLNDPQSEGWAIFHRDEIDACLNHGRTLGLSGLPQGYRLVAGLDPSGTGYQAAFLWAAVPQDGHYSRPTEAQDRRYRRFMVDAHNRLGGGLDRAMEVMIDWLERYRCRIWVIEENMWKTALRHDPRLLDWARVNDVYIDRMHTTGQNKNDPVYGAGAMSRLFADELIDLPYGDTESRQKVNEYRRQLLNFSDEIRKSHRSDLHMASWFPQRQIRRWEKEEIAQRAKVAAVQSDYPVSYPGLTGFTNGMNEAPWR